MQSTWYLIFPSSPPQFTLFSSHSSLLSLKLIMEAGENMKFVLGKFFFCFSGRSGSRKKEFIKETVTIQAAVIPAQAGAMWERGSQLSCV